MKPRMRDSMVQLETVAVERSRLPVDFAPLCFGALLWVISLDLGLTLGGRAGIVLALGIFRLVVFSAGLHAVACC